MADGPIKRSGSQFLGYVPAGTVVTPELLKELAEGRGARQSYDLDGKAEPILQKLNFGPHLP